MIKIKTSACLAVDSPQVPARVGVRRQPGRSQGRQRAARCGVLIAALLAAGCAGGHPAARPAAPGRAAPAPAPASAPSASLVRIPHPDYADPASVASAFYIAWASVDAIHDGPDAYAARCAPLATASLERELAASQPATAAWQEMRRSRLVSLVQVRAVTRPDGAPAPTASVAYRSVYATRVTVTTAGRTTGSDGITLRLTRSGGRWLVSAVLFY
jgi:hypothetical protein